MSYTSFTLALVVLTSGGRSTTCTSSTLPAATSITNSTSAGALMPTLTAFCTAVVSRGASARTRNTPGSTSGKRKPPSALL